MNNLLERIYFIACTPPEPVRADINRIKEYFAAHHKSKYALRSPPHITLFPPFKYPEAHEALLAQHLKEFALHHHPFLLELNGFAAFPPRVIYIKPVKNTQLTQLHDRLLDFMKRLQNLKEEDLLKEKNRTFRPHLTVAHRDLKISEFKKAWLVYQNKRFVQSFQVDKIFLLKNRKGGWDICREMNFKE